MKKATKAQETIKNIDTDLLWVIAGLEVKQENGEELSSFESELLQLSFAVIPNSPELSLEYGGILECQFDNYIKA